jgi:hypothetical protein
LVICEGREFCVSGFLRWEKYCCRKLKIELCKEDQPAGVIQRAFLHTYDLHVSPDLAQALAPMENRQ